MTSFEQQKSQLAFRVAPKFGVTGVAWVTQPQRTDSKSENLSHPPSGKVLHGVTTERVFERFALRYARQGFHVFPLSPGSKKPLRDSHGLAEATADIDAVSTMAREHPFSNIGILTGPESGICAIDLDPLKGGFETERHLRSEGKTWPDTPVQRTRSGGRHVILQHHPLIVTGSNRLGPGIDFRGTGGYVVAAPSVVEGKSYSWLFWPPAGPAPVPVWLISYLKAEAAKKLADLQGAPKNKLVALEPEIERARKALCFIPSDDRETWLAVGMALAGSFGDSAEDLWNAWSKQSTKFNAHDQVKAWKSFKRSGRSVGTIFWLRRQYRGRSPIYSL